MDSVVKYLSLCATLFQIFGHQYFSVATLTPENQRKLPSIGYSIYFAFVFVTLTGLMVIFASYASSEAVEEKLSSKTVLNYLIQHSMYAGLILIICVSLIQSYIATPLIKKFFLNCIRIARMSQQSFQHSIDHRRIARNIFKNFFYIMIFFLATQNILYIVERIFNESTDNFIIIFAAVPLLFLNVTAFKFAFHVKMVNFHLETLDDLLREIFDCPKIIVRLLLQVSTVKPSRTIDYSIKLKNIRKILNIVYENAEIVNRGLGATVLTIVSVMVIVITATGYRIFLSILGKLPIEKVAGELNLL